MTNKLDLQLIDGSKARSARSRCIWVSWILAAATSAMACSTAVADVDAGYLLNRYQQSLKAFTRVEAEVTQSTHVHGAVDDSMDPFWYKTILYRRDGARADLERFSTTSQSADADRTPSSTARCIVYEDNMFRKYAHGGPSSMWLKGQDSDGGNADAEVEPMTSAIMHGGVNSAFWGVLDGDRMPIAQIFAEMGMDNLIVTRDSVEDIACAVVSGHHPERGEYSLFLAPGMNFAPVRLIVEKSGDDWFGAKRMSDEFPPIPGVETRTPYPSDVMTNVSADYKFSEFVQHGEFWHPLAIRVTEERVYPDGSMVTFDHDCELASLDTEPEFDGRSLFEAALEPGSKVLDVKFTQIDMEWNGKAVVPAVNMATINAIQSSVENVLADPEPSEVKESEPATTAPDEQVTSLSGTPRFGIWGLGAAAVTLIALLAGIRISLGEKSSTN